MGVGFTAFIAAWLTSRDTSSKANDAPPRLEHCDVEDILRETPQL